MGLKTNESESRDVDHYADYNASLAKLDFVNSSKALEALSARQDLSKEERDGLEYSEAAYATVAVAALGTAAGLKPGEASVSRILDEAAKNPALIESFGGEEKLRETLDRVRELDAKFEQAGGVYFKAGGSPAETAEAYNKIHVEQYRLEGGTGRPSLPSLAQHYAREIGLERGTPEYKAMMSVAFRAEMDIGIDPAYHGRGHFADVAATTGAFIQKNDELLAAGDPRAINMTPEMKGMLLTTALGHDLDHPGKGNLAHPDNPDKDIYFNERNSFERMRPLLENAGLNEKQIAQMEVMQLATSPNGPSGFLKKVEEAHRAGEEIDFNKLDPEGKFKPLYGLADRELSSVAAILPDADIYSSAAAGIDTNVYYSQLLSDETGMPAPSDKGRQFFLNNIVEREFTSDIARIAGQEELDNMIAETERRIAEAQAAEANAPAQPKPEIAAGAEPGKAPVVDAPRVGPGTGLDPVGPLDPVGNIGRPPGGLEPVGKLDLVGNFGRHAGLVAGVGVAGYMVTQGVKAWVAGDKEAAVDSLVTAAEVGIPGASVVESIAEGRVTESLIRVAEEFNPLSLVGGAIVTENLRNELKNSGFDVDPPFVPQTVAYLAASEGRPQELIAADRIYDALPSNPEDLEGAPPEVATLAEAKIMREDTLEKLASSRQHIPTPDVAEIGALETALVKIEQKYEERYDELGDDGVKIVADYLDIGNAPDQTMVAEVSLDNAPVGVGVDDLARQNVPNIPAGQLSKLKI